mgnify:CR=1 FL=1
MPSLPRPSVGLAFGTLVYQTIEAGRQLTMISTHRHSLKEGKKEEVDIMMRSIAMERERERERVNVNVTAVALH